MLEVRYVFEHSLRGDRGPRLLRYLLANGADEFTVTVMTLENTPAPVVDAYENDLAPYARETAVRRVLEATTSEDQTTSVRLWTLNEESLKSLLHYFQGGLFDWPAGPQGWLEDLTIYRHSELVLGLVSHEQEGVLRLTELEHAQVAALGIPSEQKAEWIGY